MSEAEARDLLTALLRDILRNPSIDPQPDDREADIPGFDSGTKLMLLIALEERLAIRLRSREIDALRRFGDWVALLQRHRNTSF
jgi:acyl carrier protein